MININIDDIISTPEGFMLPLNTTPWRRSTIYRNKCLPDWSPYLTSITYMHRLTPQYLSWGKHERDHHHPHHPHHLHHHPHRFHLEKWRKHTQNTWTPGPPTSTPWFPWVDHTCRRFFHSHKSSMPSTKSCPPYSIGLSIVKHTPRWHEGGSLELLICQPSHCILSPF